MNSDDSSRWVDADAGPVARPYMLTGGRTRPRGRTRLDLIDFCVRTGKPAEDYHATPERAHLLQLCRDPITIADLAAVTRIPLGLVRVLVADLLNDGLVTVRAQAPAGRVTDTGLLQKVLNGLQALLHPGHRRGLRRQPGFCPPGGRRRVPRCASAPPDRRTRPARG
jgi:Protein of unknown function (DUF742)